jgi:predicted N-formylglutamate amidohydrolase
VTTDSFLITCEHGGNHIPLPYRGLFRGQGALLASHRGYDAGALVMARALARGLRAPVVSATVSRLLVDLNRSIGNPRVFSAATRGAPPRLRAEIVDRHYLPYRAEVERRLRRAVVGGRRVIHISSHSFTPVLDGSTRNADVGLLYDPGRRGERVMCAHWKSEISGRAPQLRVRRNYPYAGKGDGMTAYLRRCFPPSAYIGVELEINQGIVAPGGRRWRALRKVLIDSLCSLHAVRM